MVAEFISRISLFGVRLIRLISAASRTRMVCKRFVDKSHHLVDLQARKFETCPAVKTPRQKKPKLVPICAAGTVKSVFWRVPKSENAVTAKRTVLPVWLLTTVGDEVSGREDKCVPKIKVRTAVKFGE